MAPKFNHQQELQVHGCHMIRGTGLFMYGIPPPLHWESFRFSVEQGPLIRQWDSLGRGAQPISVNLISKAYWLLAEARQVVILELLSCLRLHRDFTICDSGLEFTYRKIHPTGTKQPKYPLVLADSCCVFV